MSLTITEALAEIKTIGKRIEAKRNSAATYMARIDAARDPLEKEGGSVAYIVQERQAIGDLNERIVMLRRGIQHANDTTKITVGAMTKTISEWLTWRREVAPGERQFLAHIRNQINALRDKAMKSGAAVVTAGSDARAHDFIVNVNEQELAKQLEAIEEIIGSLDGQLSLKNATVTIKE